jgi:6-phosphofructokinase
MKIGILTGGGDVPGLNATIKQLVLGCHAHGWQTLGFRRGWMGPMAVCVDDPDALARHTWVLTPEVVRTIDRTGGTILHSSRTHPKRVTTQDLPAHAAKWAVALADGTWDLTALVMANLDALGIDVLVCIGGDDTLSYGAHLSQLGVAVVGIPKTMDNDVRGTEYCLGFATCVSRTVQYVHQLRTSAGSHERIAVVEVMGRHSGASALWPGYLACADRVLIAEHPFCVDHLARLLAQDLKQNPSDYAMVLVSEGAQIKGEEIMASGIPDAYGHRKLGGIGQQVGAALTQRLGRGILHQALGYLVRSGPPDTLDIMVTFNFATLAIELIAKQKFGTMVNLQAGRYGHVSLTSVAGGARALDVRRLYDTETLRPKISHLTGSAMYL